ncbi:MAG TPA: hypothetical protein VGO68_08880 [Pyrinomonadaceae bacterium]|jgi:hypothetical protein|nr:hypothetical protein [Pyrinomonadaceae bacterium]
MFSEKRAKLIALVSLVLLIAASGVSRPRKMQRLSTGAWGGPHIRIQVDGASATIDYDCAHGTITGPLTFDSKGRFSWRGTHTLEGPGPIRVEEESKGSPATYTGTVQGDKLTLTVKLSDTKQVVDTFTLTRGGKVRIFKCK